MKAHVPTDQTLSNYHISQSAITEWTDQEQA